MPDTRSCIFDRLVVDHMLRGVTRVSWSIRRLYEPEPYSFQLQAGRTGLPNADDWEDVGPPAVNTSYAVDDVRRLAGTNLATHDRVALTAANGEVYTSHPAAVYGLLSGRDWCIAAEILRKAKLLNRNFVGTKGWLLKRRHVGTTPVSTSRRNTRVDPLTGDIIRAIGEGAALTKGTDLVDGYYAPYPFEVDMPGGGSAANTDLQRGTYDTAIPFPGCRFIAFPYVDLGDVFVSDGSDRRYAIGDVAIKTSHRGVPLLAEATLMLLPFNDIAYTFAVPEAR